MNETVKHTILGITGTGTGVAVSLSNVELWLRISSLVIGIAVGCMSGYSLLLTIQRKRQKIQQESEPDTDL